MTSLVIGGHSASSCSNVSLSRTSSCISVMLTCIPSIGLYGYPPFVSKSRHVTRQKILTWRQSLKFPARPRASRDAQDLISRLICEREERLGTRSSPSTIRPNAIVVQQRRSGFLGPAPGFAGLSDGTGDIKAHPWFRGIDFATLHLQEPPFKPDLSDPSDTRYFDDDIEDKPLRKLRCCFHL